MSIYEDRIIGKMNLEQATKCNSLSYRHRILYIVREIVEGARAFGFPNNDELISYVVRESIP